MGERFPSSDEFTFGQALTCAWRGVVHLFRTQRNAKIHTFFALAAVLLGFSFSISPNEWLAVVLCMMLVFSLEAANTALESAVDLSTSEYHKLAEIAKDCAAGAVLISAIGSLVVAAIIFLPRIIALFIGA